MQPFSYFLHSSASAPVIEEWPFGEELFSVSNLIFLALLFCSGFCVVVLLILIIHVVNKQKLISISNCQAITIRHNRT